MLHVVSARNVAAAAQAFGKLGFSVQEVRVLISTLQETGITPAALAHATCIARSTLSHMLDRLEDQGLLTRRRAAEDGRSYRILLTEKGRRAARECNDVARLYEDVLLSKLSVTDQRALLALLKKMLEP